MRRALLITALLASHGAVLWMARNSPVAGTGSAIPEAPPSAGKPASAGLAGFLRNADQAPEEATAELEEEEDEATLLARAKAAIPANADLVALVKAATSDPDLDVSIATRAAFGLWVDHDPVAALRWLAEWRRDANYSGGLDDEFSRHLQEGGLAKLRLYLREVPLAREFLIAAATEEELATCTGFFTTSTDKFGAADILQAAATLDSSGERAGMLSRYFSSMDRCTSHLSRIRSMLDDRGAAAFLGLIGGSSPSPGFLEELEHAGFPSYAVRQFVAEHSGWSRYGQTRTNADFIGTVANFQIPGDPQATGTNVTDIVTDGLRSGYGAINRNNIDAVLNNPNRTAPEALTADSIRDIFRSGNDVAWAWFSDGGLRALPGFAENREDFLRGKITGEEWVTRLQDEIPGAGDLHAELTTLVFRVTVEEDPRRALGLLGESQPYQDLMMKIWDFTPEVSVAMAGRFSGGGELPEAVKESLAARARDWANEDPGSYANFMEELPGGPVRDYLQTLPTAEEESGE